MALISSFNTQLIIILNSLREWIAPLSLRFFLAYEFWEAGVEKLHGQNWFADIQSRFPYPINLIPVNINWQLATWTEILCSIALAIGLYTRTACIGLIIIDIVAWASVHANNGYNVCDNGYKLPLIYLVILLPLLFYGPGRLSLDYLRKK